MKAHMKLLQIILLFFCAVNFSLKNNASISDDEYQIYSTILDKYLNVEKNKNVILCDSTMLDFFYSNLRYKFSIDSLYFRSILSTFNLSDSTEIYESYNFKNKNKYRFSSEKFKSDINIIIIKQSDFERFFENGNNWNSFYKSYPNSIGYVRFTKAGFNHQKNRAVLFYEIYCGNTCGEGIYFLLEKHDDQWEINQKRTMWES